MNAPSLASRAATLAVLNRQVGGDGQLHSRKMLNVGLLESVDTGDLRAAQRAAVLGLNERRASSMLAAYRSRGVPSRTHSNRIRRTQRERGRRCRGPLRLRALRGRWPHELERTAL